MDDYDENDFFESQYADEIDVLTELQGKFAVRETLKGGRMRSCICLPF